MPYDVAFRHQQALDTSALTTVGSTLHAIQAALADCRNAGKEGETDPAVILLARHLSDVCRDRPDERALRHACMDAIAELRRHPALLTLCVRGVAYDEAAKSLFHADGRKALRRLAEALELNEDSYDLRSDKAGVASSGKITLHGEEVWVSLSLSSMGPGNEVLYRRVQGRRDHCGGRNHWASIRDLLMPDRFADRLSRELGIVAPSAQPARLFA